MLKHNILSKDSRRKILTMIIIINIMTYIIYIGTGGRVVYAAQTKEAYSSKINNYQGYAALITAMKKQHPNWNFTLFYTGLDWNTVIRNEAIIVPNRNLVPLAKASYWINQEYANQTYEGGGWKSASVEAVSYYMDPRNWLTEEYIFQFEDLSYNSATQTINGVNAILNGTWMSGSVINYVKTDGTQGTINKSYAQAIIDAAATTNISPYHLASRMRQEQGASSASVTGIGTYEGYVGYYNLFNIAATGKTTADIAKSGLTRAKEKGWTDPELSIKGGAEFLATHYISRGQSTLYLQKFDVDNSDGSLYSHQYMQNVSAALTEGNTIKKAYARMGVLDHSINFVIPVYENMPTNDLARINCNDTSSSVNLRSVAGTAGTVVTSMPYGLLVKVLERDAGTSNGYTWAKIIAPNGIIGFVATTYLGNIENVIVIEQTLDNFKIEGDKLICEPNTKVGKIKETHLNAVVTKSGVTLANTDLIGTGCIVSIEGKSYTIAKLGDVNGDGSVKSTDYMDIKNYIMGGTSLTEEQKSAADVNFDGSVKSTDYMQIKNHIMGTSKISL